MFRLAKDLLSFRGKDSIEAEAREGEFFFWIAYLQGG